MNTLLKGSIAGVAGIALLLGGAGTFALWNSSATVDGGTIVAGELDVEAAAAGVWTVNGAATMATLDDFVAVPGDTMVFTQTLNITASGDNLVATLELDPASIGASTVGNDADDALALYLQKGAVLAADGTGIGVVSADNVTTITAGATGVTEAVDVTVTIDFPQNAVAGFENDTMLGSVDLSDMALTLTQK
ncbi:alternate-type signal peptide domain-containing protein [Cryobacterium melibiosiphilum]|uniref:Alternate-type signal peptide domain-containing protein n=1 Tax=Cryobacterium melibiosiphilum TaxID=995039 RepID=A0A3A5MAV6_9MICO|nr:alternate-type signal peptide domain-containing protein [Cryobacterium melibiosiphilum]RJT85218.1 alternate-type signal peptide domain-containing protein [Cryobacterium melibiosiphilum]